MQTYDVQRERRPWLWHGVVDCVVTYYDFLEKRLAQPLPAFDAHREFVPNLPDAATRLSAPPPTARRSAVVVPLVVSQRPLPDVLLEVRSLGLRHHRGQISFPGGRIDEGEDAVTAALRELHEEVGIAPHDVAVLGMLTPLFIPPSNSAVVPVVGLLRSASNLTLSAHEVDEVISVPLEVLVDRASITTRKRDLYGSVADVAEWSVHHRVPLWGATAMMLNELVWITREYMDLGSPAGLDTNGLRR
jgi:8-oxo-dGTP pyrophosphatase MutT (NUDIX family)